MIEWFEDLPEQCPPKEAFIPNKMTVYRFSFTEVPQNIDFISHRMLNPKGIFNGVDECIVRALSVLDKIEACQNRLKLPRNRKRFSSILEVNLDENDGLVMKTFKDPNHFSWWRSNSFNFEKANKIL